MITDYFNIVIILIGGYVVLKMMYDYYFNNIKPIYENFATKGEDLRGDEWKYFLGFKKEEPEETPDE